MAVMLLALEQPDAWSIQMTVKPDSIYMELDKGFRAVLNLPASM